jgi:hypothetical protein
MPCAQLQRFVDTWCLPLQDLRINSSRNADKYLKMGGEELGAVREKEQIDFDENRRKRQYYVLTHPRRALREDQISRLIRVL